MRSTFISIAVTMGLIILGCFTATAWAALIEYAKDESLHPNDYADQY